MRILLISQWYPPEPVRIVEELALGLRDRGHQVVVVTGFPNYPRGVLYDGYRLRPWRRETMAGIPVLRLPLYPNHSRSAIGRLLNYGTFALAASLAPLLVRRCDVIYAYGSPVTALIPARVAATLWRVPYVASVPDLWPEALAAAGVRSRAVMSVARRIANSLYGRAARVVAVSRAFAGALRQRIGGASVVHVPVWVDTAQYRPVAADASMRETLGITRRTVVMYAGHIGLAQGLDTVIDAADQLRHRDDIEFVLVGDGVARARLMEEVRSRGLDNVRFPGSFPAEQMSEVYSTASALLVHLADEPLLRMWIPHKIFAYMAVAKPILCAAAGETSDIVEEAGAGLACPPANASRMAELVARFADMPEEERQAFGARGRSLVEAQYARDALIARNEEILRDAVASNTSSSPGRSVRHGVPTAGRNVSWHTRALYPFAKRALDLAVAVPALVIAAPVMAGVALAVRLLLGGPVLFRQIRPGLHGRPFEILKFRTMNDARDAEGNLLPDDVRLTSFGRFLRRSSLDELPQLINVVRGELSLVGPRPLLMEYLDLYTPEQARRHEVKPGITGWAQVNGRNALTWEQKFALDLWYVDHCSMTLDLRILMMTAAKVSSRRGVEGLGNVKFTGSVNAETQR